MPDTETPGSTAKDEAKSHFAKAMEEAKAGAQALGKEAQGRAEQYRDKIHQKKDGLSSEAHARTGEARDKAYDLANEGKTKASHAISSFGKLVEDNAAMLDEKVGPKYGGYARDAAGYIQQSATRLDEKSLEELGEDARQFVRQSPALAVGMAAAAGFMVARVFQRRK